jgi:hypothetical protein
MVGDINTIMNDTEVQVYTELRKELKELQQKQKAVKDKIKACDAKILEYMTTQAIDTINSKGITISLYKKKTSQKFKKEEIESLITEKLCDSEMAKELAECVVANPVHLLSESLKVTLV